MNYIVLTILKTINKRYCFIIFLLNIDLIYKKLIKIINEKKNKSIYFIQDTENEIDPVMQF